MKIEEIGTYLCMICGGAFETEYYSPKACQSCKQQYLTDDRQDRE